LVVLLSFEHENKTHEMDISNSKYFIKLNFKGANLCKILDSNHHY
jgi:hypothetical protein